MANFAAIAALGLSLLTSPLAIVIIVSLVIGLVMVVLFGYTSDQKAIGIAKDQLKAHLLAVRLYRDQIPVVMGSYGKILRGTGRYLKLAFMPLLYVIVPITLLMVQIDRYLGQTSATRERAVSDDGSSHLGRYVERRHPRPSARNHA